MRDYPNREGKLKQFYANRMSMLAHDESVIESKMLGSQQLEYEQLKRISNSLINRGIELSICQFSLGHSIDTIRETVERTITYYLKTDNEWSSYPHSVYTLVKLISLAILVDVSDKTWALLAEKWQVSGSNGHILAKFLSYRSNNIQLEQDVRVNNLFGQILTTSNISDDCEFLEELKKYSKKWYIRYKGLHWYNSHNDDYHIGYFGYWAVEAAAVAKMRGISLKNTHFGKYFPYGFFDLPEQLPKEKGVKKELQQKEQALNTVTYPGLTRLTLSLDGAWLNESEQRLSLITHDEGLECAGTVYLSDENTLDSFASGRYEALMKHMPWYKRVGVENERNLPIGIVKEQLMQGVWKGETEVTSYLVYALKFDKYFMGLTFTFMEKDKTNCLPLIERLLESIRYE